ncbi:hypothetical protein EJ110_NYTH35849 [Nymphaea thermarum]|nr:hypothetical protein EJ110_NYTH35849 [Nymphaea thermarum]
MQQRAGEKRAGWAASCCRAPRWSGDRRTTWVRPGCHGSDKGGRVPVSLSRLSEDDGSRLYLVAACLLHPRRTKGAVTAPPTQRPSPSRMDGRKTTSPSRCTQPTTGCRPSPGWCWPLALPASHTRPAPQPSSRRRTSADARGRATPGEGSASGQHLGPLPVVGHQPTHVAEPFQEKEGRQALPLPGTRAPPITTSGTKKGDLLLADVNTQLKNGNVTTDIKVDTNSKVELQYFHDHGGISTCIGLTANPIVKFSGVLGSSAVALGTDVAFDTATGNFTMYNGALSYSNADRIACLNLSRSGRGKILPIALLESPKQELHNI